jgi:hypothetical protein
MNLQETVGGVVFDKQSLNVGLEIRVPGTLTLDDVAAFVGRDGEDSLKDRLHSIPTLFVHDSTTSS